MCDKEKAVQLINEAIEIYEQAQDTNDWGFAYDSISQIKIMKLDPVLAHLQIAAGCRKDDEYRPWCTEYVGVLRKLRDHLLCPEKEPWPASV